MTLPRTAGVPPL